MLAVSTENYLSTHFDMHRGQNLQMSFYHPGDIKDLDSFISLGELLSEIEAKPNVSRLLSIDDATALF